MLCLILFFFFFHLAAIPMDLSLLPCFQVQVGEREMSSSTRQDWSDEDEDDVTQIETSVLLGVPDGPVESASDLKDAAVSRIGGLPVRPIHYSSMYLHFVENIRCHSQALLSPQVPFESSYCQHCKNPMELLVQLWAPFEDSPYDRAVYVWGCARSGCQRKGGRYVPHATCQGQWKACGLLQHQSVARSALQ
jgi:hypothetical protein